MYCPKIFHNYGISHVCFVRFCIKRINRDDRSKSLVLILNSWVSEGSVATQFRWEWNLYHRHVDTFLGNPTVKEFCKLVYFCWNHDNSQVSIFWDSVLLYYYCIIYYCMNSLFRPLVYHSRLQTTCWCISGGVLHICSVVVVVLCLLASTPRFFQWQNSILLLCAFSFLLLLGHLAW